MASSSANIHGHTLEVIVVGGTKLKNTAIVGKQDPFVELIYGGSKYRTKPCKVSGTNPVFHDKFMIELIQGLRKIKISVYNRNALSKDVFIGEGKVSLSEVLRKGCKDTTFYLNNNSWAAGEIRLIMMYPHALLSYEEMRVTMEKAENNSLMSYQSNSAPEQAKVGNQLDLELTNMKIKLAAKDAQLTTLTTELDGCRKAAQHEVAAVSKRLAYSELALKQLRDEVTLKDAELNALREQLNSAGNQDSPLKNMHTELTGKDHELNSPKTPCRCTQTCEQVSNGGICYVEEMKRKLFQVCHDVRTMNGSGY